MVILSADGLTVIRAERPLLDHVSLQVLAGRVIALVGPNGAGKSSLLRVLSGEWAADRGTVSLAGRPLTQWPAEARARQRAVLSQQVSVAFDFPAREIVSWGRMPHRTGRKRDLSVVEQALALCDLGPCADRPYSTLSGGERQRVQWARVLAQAWEMQGAALLLDEPTSALDVPHQHSLLRTLVERSRAWGWGVVVALHDIGLAARYADDVALLREGRMLAVGAATEVVTAAHLTEVFGVPMTVAYPGQGRQPLIIPAGADGPLSPPE